MNNSYQKINIAIAGIIILMISYSGIFSVSGLIHPLKTIYSFPVVSTGLSRSFSEIVRGNFYEANQYNRFGIRIFTFFIIQLFLRLLISFLLFIKMFSKNTLLFADILITVLLFLWAFVPFVYAQVKMLVG